MNLDNVTRDDWIVGGLALLLAIFLIVLPWFDLSVGPYSASFSATSSPDGWLGVLGFIAALAVVVDLAIERLSPQTTLPAVKTRTNTRFLLACVAAGFVVLKFLFHIHFSLFGWGFYVDVIVAAALVFMALQVNRGQPAGFNRPGGPGGGTGVRGGTGGGTVGTPPSGGVVGTPPPGGAAGTPPVGGSTPPPSAPGSTPPRV